MRVLGQGHHGVVIAGKPGTVEKFYNTTVEWEKEKAKLTFLAHLQKSGFTVNYIIPELINSATGTWKINGRSYNFCNVMQHISGTPAGDGVNQQNLESFGRALGILLAEMHQQTKAFTLQYKKDTGAEDMLLHHIVDENAGKIKKIETEENDRQVRQWVDEAADYLQKELPQRTAEMTLSHQDLNLWNILIDGKGSVNGLVDWGDFGITHPSLSLYQLATNPTLWAHIKKHYQAAGGVILEDIIYAASTIHLAWAPLICKELGQALDEHETRTRLNEVYTLFTATRNSI